MIFKIKKGKHKSSGIHFGFTLKNEIKFEGIFHESCLYKFNDVDAYDINKLYGISTTYFHQKQSARVGWRCLDGVNIELLTYSYNNGNRIINESNVLGLVKPNEKFYVTIIDQEDNYKYTFQKENSKDVTVFDPKKRDWFIFHYYLYPYFGGNKTAPHDMKISIKKL